MTLRNIIIFPIVVRDFVVEAAPTNLLFGHKTLPASKSLLPTMLQYSNSSRFTSEYITWDTISLPASIFMFFPLWMYLPLDISRVKCSIILLHGPHRAAYSTWCPPSFSLQVHSAFSQVDVQCCQSPALPTGSPIKPGNLFPDCPIFASLLDDLQLPQCFRQVSHGTSTTAVLCAEVVQPGCFLHHLRISKITFSDTAVASAFCITESQCFAPPSQAAAIPCGALASCFP